MVEVVGGSALTGNGNSGAGAGGYPAAGIGRRSGLGRGPEETTLAQLGGYTAGMGETKIVGGINGLGSQDTVDGEAAMGPGGGYYSYGTTLSTEWSGNYEGWFGLGGCWSGYVGREEKWWSTAGSGGVAGQGGTIEYSPTSKIYSYNGNRITEDNFNYNETYFEYDKDGSYLDGNDGRDRVVAKVIKLKNDPSKKIIPTKIFLQEGTKRKVYDNLCYMSEERKKQYGVNGDVPSEKIKNASIGNYVQCVQIIAEELNVTHSRQGIGSGAGYIEVSNGTFEQINIQ